MVALKVLVTFAVCGGLVFLGVVGPAPGALLALGSAVGWVQSS